MASQRTRCWMVLAALALLVAPSLAYPQRVRVTAAGSKPTFQECQQHPQQPNRVHFVPMGRDTLVSYTLLNNGRPVTRACPGVPYTVRMTSGFASRRCLVTTNKGSFSGAPDSTCPNRWWTPSSGSMHTPTLTTSCKTAPGSIRITATCTGGFAQPFLRSTFNVTLLAPTAAECQALPNYRCASAAAKA